ncbi:hypothetical protein BDZ89DRAFT_1045145 [Hymenopellis radicata]|nr:hypothetical protein BDZ89DRAFT_1045145 [Hymenopellis radicata]
MDRNDSARDARVAAEAMSSDFCLVYDMRTVVHVVPRFVVLMGVVAVDGGGRGGTGSSSFRPDYRMPQLAFEYNSRCGVISHPSGDCKICDDYRVYLNEPQERREPTFIAARDAQYANETCRSQPTAHPKMVADAITLAKQYVGDDAGLAEEQALPDIIMVYGEDPAKSPFDVLKAPRRWRTLFQRRIAYRDKRTGLRETAVTVAIVEFLDYIPGSSKAKALLRGPRATTPPNADPAEFRWVTSIKLHIGICLIDYHQAFRLCWFESKDLCRNLQRSASVEPTRIQGLPIHENPAGPPVYSQQNTRWKLTVRSPSGIPLGQRLGVYEAYFLLQAVLWLTEWEFGNSATNGTISLTRALKHVGAESAKVQEGQTTRLGEFHGRRVRYCRMGGGNCLHRSGFKNLRLRYKGFDARRRLLAEVEEAGWIRWNEYGLGRVGGVQQNRASYDVSGEKSLSKEQLVLSERW